MPSEERVFVAPSEFARRYSLSKFTVYKWIKDARIPCVRLGKSVRLDPALVLAALQAEGDTDAK